MTGLVSGSAWAAPDARREAIRAAEAYRQALLEAGAEDTVLTDRWTGRWARVIRNRLLDKLAAADPLPPYLQQSTLMDVMEAAAVQSRREHLPLYAGRSVGLIRDLPGAGEVVRRMLVEAEAAIRDAWPGAR